MATRSRGGGERDGDLRRPEGRVGDEPAERGEPVCRLALEAGHQEPPVNPGRRAHRKPDPTSAPSESRTNFGRPTPISDASGCGHQADGTTGVRWYHC